MNLAVAPVGAVVAASRKLRVPSRMQMMQLEEAIRTQLQPVECEVKHHFSDGVYMRELFIPKGTILTGKIHKRPHLNIISAGDISVLTSKGMRRITAPNVVYSEPGIKRAGFTHEDTVWITVHPTNETDIEKIEAEFTADSFEELDEYLALEGVKQACLGSQ